jgi:hypothetical protein
MEVTFRGFAVKQFKSMEGRFFLHSPSTATTGNGLHVIKGHLYKWFEKLYLQGSRLWRS